MTKRIKKSFIQQQDQSDCGVACLLSLINYYGGTSSLEKLREISGTNTQGTTLLGLYQAANNVGFNAEGCEADIQALIKHKEPLILHVLIDKRLHHYVVCYGYKESHFIIGDPAIGIIKYTIKELERIWIEHKCLTLEPTVKFIKSNKIKLDKRNWLIRLIKDDYPLIGTSILLGIGITILGMVMSIFSQKLIDDILPSDNIKKLITGISFVTVLLIVRTGLISIRQFLLLRQSKDFNNRIINAFYNTLLYLPKSFFDTRKIGELVARLNDTGRIQRVISQIAGNVIIDGLMTITSLVFLYVYSWQSGVIASISLPIYFLLIYRFNSKIIIAQKEVMINYANSESNYINTMQGISIIKNYNRQKLFTNINQLIYGRFQDKIFLLGKINIRLTLISGIAGVFFLISILTYTSSQVYYNTLTVGELMAILGMASTLLPSVANLALLSIPINEAKVAFDRMFDFVNISSEENISSKKLIFKSLEIKNISFRFPGRPPILNNISIKVSRNEFVAIIGESGSGKSTLGQIIQQFYLPESGTININNTITFDKIGTNTWRDVVGVVPQNIHMFNGTIVDNICLSSTKEEAEKVLKFCREYGFSQFIEQLPQSYITVVGEEGINLSGGEKQIIAIARALYNNPQILLLDEATAAMDRLTEKFVLNLLVQLKSKIGIIFISHRLHILRNISDNIYILDKGKIKAQGNHKTLLKSKNFYSEYWKDIN